MKVYLSNSVYLGNFDAFLRKFDPSEPDKLEIATHDRWINVHPAVLVMIAALGMTVESKNIKIDNVVARSGHYLDRMGLFKALHIDSPFSIAEHEQAGRFIPISVIKTSDDQTRFITEMIPLLHLAPAQADAIKYTIGELVRNVIEHSWSKYGAIVAAQYYPKSNTIRLGICDTGVGIKKTINQSWHASDDLAAIKLALVPGVSGTTRREGGTDINAGAGLFFIKSMAMVGRDYFMVYSGNGLYKLLKRRPTKGLPRLNADPGKDKHAESSVAPQFPGTVVAIDISLDTTDEFTSLLGVIRRTYTQAVRERRKARYKRPQFI
jgi:hypothetical protein